MKETVNNWHLQLFDKSILKKNKLKEILTFLPPTETKTCLDLGGDNGIISYFLRQKGGSWHSADLTDQAVDSIKSLVKTNVTKINGKTLPFPNNHLDIVVIIDMLEHIQNDTNFIDELHRVMKKSGTLIINVPYIKKISIIKVIKSILKQSDEKHGHLRPGYTKKHLRSMLENKFIIEKEHTYSRFFTELLDIGINFMYSSSNNSADEGSKGLLITDADLDKNKKKFKLYSILYPFMWLFSKLDIFIFFTQGHKLIIKSIKS